MNASFIVTFLCNWWKINISQCFIVKESNLILLLEPNMSVSLLGGKSIWALTSLVQTLNFFPLAGECFRTSGSPLPQVTIEWELIAATHREIDGYGPLKNHHSAQGDVMSKPQTSLARRNPGFWRPASLGFRTWRRMCGIGERRCGPKGEAHALWHRDSPGRLYFDS